MTVQIESKEMDQKAKTVCLKSYESHLPNTIKDIFHENRYMDADVILVSEQQIPVQAHKIILGAFSSTFKYLLLNNIHPKPLLYLRGVEHEDLLSILQYLYLGKVTIDKTRMNKFMEVAIDLQIDEFIHGNQLDLQVSDLPGEILHGKDDFKIVDNFGNKLHEFSENLGRSSEQDYFINPGDATKNEKSPSYKCEKCEYQTVWKGDIKKHNDSKHEGIRYSCNNCEYKASFQVNLKRHHEKEHIGINYSCHSCVYKTKDKSRLQEHKKTKHEGFRYNCDFCDFKGMQKAHVKQHVRNKHEGLRYPCFFWCQYKATTKSGLKRHQETQHDKF